MVRETRYLWVANLPDTVNEDQIAEYFGRQGSVFVCLVIVCDCRRQMVGITIYRIWMYLVRSFYIGYTPVQLLALGLRNPGISILMDISRRDVD